MEIEFKIKGNQKDDKGNPIPYKRVLNHSWRADATDYKEWQEYVINCLLEQTENKEFVKNHYTGDKPIKLEKEQKAVMDLVIEWADGRHGDPDNIFKGIADALFSNDKELDGSFKSSYNENKEGSVEVKIKIFNN